MNVPNITQGPGSATVLPRAVAAAEPLTRTRADAAGPAPVRPHEPTPGISLTRLACFDVNGDGTIDPRSAGSGGDATLLVPTHEVDLPTWSYAANPLQGSHPTKASVTRTKEPAAGDRAVPSARANSAQTNRAVGAYQRYGQGPAAKVPDTTPIGTTTSVAPTPGVPNAEGTPKLAPAAAPVSTPAVAAA